MKQAIAYDEFDSTTQQGRACRRLLAAVVARAIVDYLEPRDKEDYRSARRYLYSRKEGNGYSSFRWACSVLSADGDGLREAILRHVERVKREKRSIRYG